MRKTLVNINSRNRSSVYPSSNSFVTTLNRRLADISRIQIKSIEIPFSYYVVNSNNNVISFTDTIPTTYTATLTPGNYTAAELLSEIQSKMTVQMSTFSGGSFNSKTLKFTLVNSTENFNILYATTTARELLGLSGNTGLTGSWTSDDSINIGGTNHIYIMSSALTQGRDFYYQDDKERSVFYRLPVDASFGEIIRDHAPNDSSASYDYNVQSGLHRIDLELRDEDFNLIDLNGLNWSIEFIVWSKQD